MTQFGVTERPRLIAEVEYVRLQPSVAKVRRVAGIVHDVERDEHRIPVQKSNIHLRTNAVVQPQIERVDVVWRVYSSAAIQIPECHWSVARKTFGPAYPYRRSSPLDDFSRLIA
jgi:hypothetical protein